MRLRSCGFSGLWSSDNGIALPFRISMALESPTFATMTSLRLKSTAATQAVDPQAAKGCSMLGSSLARPHGPERKLVSSRGSACSSAIASEGCEDPAAICSRHAAWTMSTSKTAASSETCFPPWPSKTAKRATSLHNGLRLCTTWASSIDGRQPRIPQVAQLTVPDCSVPDWLVTARSGVGPLLTVSMTLRTMTEPMKTSIP
mmetsp:Transcript_19618/g.45675  ORF Transcript_19618/g.45675 Transcript_19618/m.45675 type:complete len:202 (+) Transcript_19618:810-1415(+)